MSDLSLKKENKSNILSILNTMYSVEIKQLPHILWPITTATTIDTTIDDGYDVNVTQPLSTDSLVNDIPIPGYHKLIN